MNPKIPMDILSPDEINMAQVFEYLNMVLEYYGPPCNWCKHYDLFCEIGFRPRKYDMEVGPFAVWTMRIFCQSFEDDKGRQSEGDSATREMVSKMLNCNAQTYGN